MMRHLDPTEYQVIDLHPVTRRQPSPARPYPQLTELLAGICVVAILIGCVGYTTAFSYHWLQNQGGATHAQ